MTAAELYGKHCDMLMHYSSRIFAARITTVTFTVLMGLLVLGQYNLRFFSLPTGTERSEWVPYGLSVLIIVLWMMELGYFKKFNEIICSCQKLERLGQNQIPETFFQTYHPFTHRVVYASYLGAALVFILNSDSHLSLKIPIYMLLTIPVIQMFYIANIWVDRYIQKNNISAIPVRRRLWYCLSFILWGWILQNDSRVRVRLGFSVFASVMVSLILVIFIIAYSISG